MLAHSYDGSYTYIAGKAKALPSDGVGIDTFTYTAQTDDGGTATSSLSVVVTNLPYVGGTSGVTLTGGMNKTVLDGGAGHNTLIAGKGGAVEIGGPDDTLTGSKAPDAFVFAPNFGQNTITNFDPKKDVIYFDHSEFADFQAVLADAHQVIGGADIVIAHGADQLTLTGVHLSQLHANDFFFV